MEILVIGAGFVGVTTAITFAELGHTVTCIDKDHEKIKVMHQGEPYFYEPNLKGLVKKHLQSSRIQFSTEFKQPIENCEIIFICVGTPSLPDGSADLRYIREVSETIGTHINEYKIIVVKSTVPIGTCREVQERIEKFVRSEVEFDVVSNPEFLREGNAVFDSLHPSRVVIGSTSPLAASRLEEIYKPLNCPVVHTDPQTAELIKYASNSFLATKISYMNQLARFCDAVHVNIRDVALGMGLDPRIGDQFLAAGVGYGGSCFPKDVQALLAMANDYDVNLSILEQVHHVNKTQHAYLLGKLESELGSLASKVVAVFGLAFKPDTSDTREAPAWPMIQYLIEQGAEVKVHDPVASLPPCVKGNVEQCETLEATVHGADALLICTDWPQYRECVDWSKLKSMMRDVYIFDGRNMLDANLMRSLGFSYQGIGYS